ncbi:MAG: hypothetical protein UT40_C0009G0006 [Candidatus Woesebacteria bacterium GW2011_GWA1_39_21b]|uniref:Uncharacterized protein n=1 Tax=Candidatus Woesebacteria bacterium GW2011_GWA1_39_21b TaxID=1618551 RepID=A0A0G0NM01_9BACT|nr:MAG: hypothetical protein UT40_C0009G0006 [Candidatus Woesebacteria bacterium GW2011_GWA1_39_21b]KKS87985.1 MAG: hypothetical protein UV64_C0034G0006 [Parcubacteria group bacterium GW2011_GWC1_43_11b]
MSRCHLDIFRIFFKSKKQTRQLAGQESKLRQEIQPAIRLRSRFGEVKTIIIARGEQPDSPSTSYCRASPRYGSTWSQPRAHTARTSGHWSSEE